MATNNYRYFNILDSVIFRLICGTNFANAYRDNKPTIFNRSSLTQAIWILSENGWDYETARESYEMQMW